MLFSKLIHIGGSGLTLVSYLTTGLEKQTLFRAYIAMNCLLCHEMCVGDQNLLYDL